MCSPMYSQAGSEALKFKCLNPIFLKYFQSSPSKWHEKFYTRIYIFCMRNTIHPFQFASLSLSCNSRSAAHVIKEAHTTLLCSRMIAWQAEALEDLLSQVVEPPIDKNSNRQNLGWVGCQSCHHNISSGLQMVHLICWIMFWYLGRWLMLMAWAVTLIFKQYCWKP